MGHKYQYFMKPPGDSHVQQMLRKAALKNVTAIKRCEIVTKHLMCLAKRSELYILGNGELLVAVMVLRDDAVLNRQGAQSSDKFLIASSVVDGFLGD